MARPSKFSPEVVEKIVLAVRAGNFVEVAAVYAGVSASTLYEWLRRGREGDSRYAAFVEELEQAQAAAEVGHVAQLSEAGRRDWRASARWLALARRERWADRPSELPAGKIEVRVRWPEEEGVIAEGPFPKEARPGGPKRAATDREEQ